MTAPATAPINPADWPGRYQPSAWPRNVAAREPMMPRPAVRKKPLGPLPGVSMRATSPAKKPMRTTQIKCMSCPPDSDFRGSFACLAVVRMEALRGGLGFAHVGAALGLAIVLRAGAVIDLGALVDPYLPGPA